MIERWDDAALDAIFRKEVAAATRDWNWERREWTARPPAHHRGTRILALAGVAVATAAFVVLALIIHQSAGNPQPPSSAGLDARQQRAVAAARVVAQGESTIPVSFVSITSGRFADFEPSAGAIVSAPGREVWVVVFRGKVIGGCGPATITGTPRACLPANATQKVILDFQTDAFVMEEVAGEGGSLGGASAPLPSASSR